uniref:Uncharacterized protein n=1 Tax=Aegilops tauschii subsp. strangulata TaxID=200361 RepID=A0A453M8F4_AEGTS
MEKLLNDDLLSRASKDGYAAIKISDPGTAYMKAEVTMHNVSPTDGAKIGSGYLKCMKGQGTDPPVSSPTGPSPLRAAEQH